MKTADIDRERMTRTKWVSMFVQAIALFSPRTLVPVLKLRHFSEFNLSLVPGGLPSGLVLDFDDTLGPHHGEVDEKNLSLIKKLRKQGLPIAVLSNASYDLFPGRYADLEAVGVIVATGVPPKPQPLAFEGTARLLGLPVTELVFVGDNSLTDGGATRVGARFILVDPFPERPWRRLGQRIPRWFYRMLGDVYCSLGLGGTAVR